MIKVLKQENKLFFIINNDINTYQRMDTISNECSQSQIKNV
jgi:tRNA-dihydrouridine synthase